MTVAAIHSRQCLQSGRVVPCSRTITLLSEHELTHSSRSDSALTPCRSLQLVAGLGGRPLPWEMFRRPVTFTRGQIQTVSKQRSPKDKRQKWTWTAEEEEENEEAQMATTRGGGRLSYCRRSFNASAIRRGGDVRSRLFQREEGRFCLVCSVAWRRCLLSGLLQKREAFNVTFNFRCLPNTLRFPEAVTSEHLLVSGMVRFMIDDQNRPY